ncbi:hypothetical protein SNSL254_A4676 [Salmonella enterica subsp. enterica serovar Newport str. SL254]|uniref:Uncharacterized protein n=1 Tax=Salmonella newport (strain SL254) TaxID=423368 RepID=A0A0H3BVG7_SALNS|nr:hypothetical protein SNSL254_A4676 [Salmonella enterica subsp. enterica serovar Newport str. SL254]
MRDAAFSEAFLFMAVHRDIKVRFRNSVSSPELSGPALPSSA